MNTLWSFLDWILPAVRLSDDLEDPYTLTNAYSQLLPSTTPLPGIRGHQPPDPRRDWTRERDDRARATEQERVRERQRIQTLERENASLYQRVAALENDLQSARQSLTTYTLISAPVPANTSTQLPLPRDALSLRTSYDSLLSSYSVMHRALQERTEEVASLKSFLSKTDEWSGAQLIQAVRDLNAEIVQLAASVAEEFAPSLDRRVDMSRPSDRDLVSSALGPAMTNLLASRDHAGDPTLVQFAIQAWQVCCVGRVLDSFCFGLPPEVDQFLVDVFERMHRAEPQPTTSRWRALTYMHARALLPCPAQIQGQPPGTVFAPFLSLNDSNLRGLLAILALSGCTDSRGVHREPLRARFGNALGRIGERAERIAAAMKEGVMSGVFEIMWGGDRSASLGKEKDPERSFDWATMENVYAGHGSERCKVLCTVEFGLMCARRVGWTDEPGDGEDHGTAADAKELNGHVNGQTNGYAATNGVRSGGMLSRNLLMKPKVLLESVADIL